MSYPSQLYKSVFNPTLVAEMSVMPIVLCQLHRKTLVLCQHCTSSRRRFLPRSKFKVHRPRASYGDASRMQCTYI